MRIQMFVCTAWHELFLCWSAPSINARSAPGFHRRVSQHGGAFYNLIECAVKLVQNLQRRMQMAEWTDPL